MHPTGIFLGLFLEYNRSPMLRNSYGGPPFEGVRGGSGKISPPRPLGLGRKRARKVAKSHRIGTKIRQHGEEDMGSPAFGSPGLERAQKGLKKARAGFRENPKNLRFL